MERIIKLTSFYLSAAILALLLCDLTSVLAGVLYVDGGVVRSGNGTSWGDAFRTVSEAVDAANAGDEIWVKAYIYPTVSTIDIGKNILLYGGFNGTETERDQRNWVNNVTTLDGQNSGVRRMYIHSDATIDGFLITGGRGGGISIPSNAPIINNCVFLGNTLTEDTFCYGGGLYSDNAFPSITNCVFKGNEVAGDYYNYGGGLYSSGVGLNLTNCIFIENKARGGNYNYGGGVYIEGSTATITNCTFVKNSVSPDSWHRPRGGGMYVNDHTTITNSILWDNYQESTNNPDQIAYQGAFWPPFISYSNIDQDGFEDGNGNMRLDPSFINPDNDDYHLQPNSPCIDAGDPASAYSNEPEPYGCRINIGAYGNTSEATTASDPDFDGIYGACDNCPYDSNRDQDDYDVDGVGHVCDNCPEVSNEGQADRDGDGSGDICDECTDTDGDGYGNPGYPSNTCPLDNCPDSGNISQANYDEDDFGDVCDQCPHDFDNDIDGDGICGDVDNCPAINNPDQEDIDGDDCGDVCDDDNDNDSILNLYDNCPLAGNPDQTDSDSDGIGDVCDGSPHFPALIPAADGHFEREEYCCYPHCIYTCFDWLVYDAITLGRYIQIPTYPTTFPTLLGGLMEFSLSATEGIFTSGMIQAELSLTVKNGTLYNACLELNNINDAQENGLIDQEDGNTNNLAGGLCTYLFPGKRITFDVTSSLEHDLFTPDQSEFSGFTLEPVGFPLGQYIEFYDHTDFVNGPRLSIIDIDLDDDGIKDVEDNCSDIYNPDQADTDGDCTGDLCDADPNDPNNPATMVDSDSDEIGNACDNCPAISNPLQEDTYPPQGNFIGNACECEGNFDCDEDTDGTDAVTFKMDFGRSHFQSPCTHQDSCNGDFSCDSDVDGTDAALFKKDFGRSSFQNPCPACTAGVQWCVYP